MQVAASTAVLTTGSMQARSLLAAVRPMQRTGCLMLCEKVGPGG